MEQRRRARMARALVVAATVSVVVAACSSPGTGAGSTTSTPNRSTTTSTTTSTTSTTAAAVPDAVPPQYAGMVQQLGSQLDDYQAAVSAMPDSRPAAAPFVPAAELLVANGNRQTRLLDPGALGLVDQQLDALGRLGVRGVTLGIKLPLLLPQFTPQAARYADFYAAVADQARSRGFTIDVELGALFCGTVFSTCSYHYPTTASGWAQLTAQQARIVIDRVHPQYLDILSEPNTEANLTSIKSLGTLAGVTRFVTETLQQIGPRGTTEVGAGAASWFPISYDRAIAATGVDILIEHIYPLTPGIVQTIVATAALAQQVHKPLVADEVWLYKGTTTGGGNVTASGNESKMDAYGFFEPLDARFLAITRQWSRKADVAFTSPFWAMQLFHYVSWTPQLEAGPVAPVLAQLDQGAATAMAEGQVSAAGAAWARSP